MTIFKHRQNQYVVRNNKIGTASYHVLINIHKINRYLTKYFRYPHGEQKSGSSFSSSVWREHKACSY